MTRNDIKLLIIDVLLAILDIALIVNYFSIKAADVDLVKLMEALP